LTFVYWMETAKRILNFSLSGSLTILDFSHKHYGEIPTAASNPGAI